MKISTHHEMKNRNRQKSVKNHRENGTASAPGAALKDSSK
jgi:hypothetical protein